MSGGRTAVDGAASLNGTGSRGGRPVEGALIEMILATGMASKTIAKTFRNAVTRPVSLSFVLRRYAPQRISGASKMITNMGSTLYTLLVQNSLNQFNRWLRMPAVMSVVKNKS